MEDEVKEQAAAWLGSQRQIDFVDITKALFEAGFVVALSPR